MEASAAHAAIFDPARSRARAVGPEHGLTDEDLASLRESVLEAHAALAAQRREGALAFARLPYEHDWLPDVLRAAEDVRGRCDDFVILGIGGSALGSRALLTALRPAVRSAQGGPRVHVLDNIDPVHVSECLEGLRPERTVFNVVTKSGGTPETAAQFLAARQWLEDALPGRAAGHFLVTTDPEKGDLRSLARAEGLPALPVPPAVGGRFSVLSPVALLPAAVAGLDVEGLLEGAAAYEDAFRQGDPLADPACAFASTAYGLHRRKGKSVTVLFTYSQKLCDVADWFRQLWAESLGKRLSLDGREVFAGTTPVRALGATDQHSQLQLYTEGPNDKYLVLLRVERPSADIRLPALYPDRASLGYLGGRTMGELFHAEFLGTETALTEARRPTARLVLPDLSARSVGWLLQMLETATVAAGRLYGVDPFDQPGVERGKVVAAALLGKPGLDEVRAELRARGLDETPAGGPDR